MKKLFTLFFALLCLVMGVSTAQAAVGDELDAIKTTSSGWASYTPSKNCIIEEEGVIVYIATAVNGNNVHLSSIDIIPAGVGVFIKAKSTGAEQTLHSIEMSNVSVSVKGNIITPVLSEDVNLSYDDLNASGKSAYVVGSYYDEVEGGTFAGICKVNQNVTIPQGRAYIILDNSSSNSKSFLAFEFDENTGVENVELENNDCKSFYNLAGQKIDSEYKGIVIGSNGKKYLK